MVEISFDIHGRKYFCPAGNIYKFKDLVDIYVSNSVLLGACYLILNQCIFIKI